MGFLNKMKSAFSKETTEETQIDTDFTEAIINSIENAPFGISDTNVIYAGESELAGFHYFKTIVVGSFRIKTNKGAQLSIKGDGFELKLDSDMVEIESEPSNIPSGYVTHIDFEIEAEDLPKITKSNIQSLELTAKKEHLKFSIIEISDEEE
jgi:hypothetical protein